MITLYLDMDGVLCNFNKAYAALSGENDRKKFRNAVITYKIFEELEFMPDARQLLNHVSRLDKGIDVQILTSMGTYDPFQANEAKSQKMHWLNKNNIPYKANFVNAKHEKANYANDHSILIDDSIGCITPFIEKMGHGIHHVNAPDSIRLLDATILQIRALDALRGNVGV
jgi:uncharacterized HAD superfamily protein